VVVEPAVATPLLAALGTIRFSAPLPQLAAVAVGVA